MKPIVTIIIPIYNVEKYIKSCIDSVVNQTYKNLEIILVNDESPDKCGEICELYAEYDHRIQVIHQKNTGLSEARNSAINQGKGDFIFFIDGDDTIPKDTIESLIHSQKKSNADIVVGDFLEVYSENKKTGILSETITNHLLSPEEAMTMLVGKKHHRIMFTTAWGKLYKKELFKDIRYPIGKLHEDLFVTHELYFKANKILMTSKICYLYLQRETSITGDNVDKDNKRLEDCLEGYMSRTEFFADKGYTELVDACFRTCFRLNHNRNTRLNCYKANEFTHKWLINMTRHCSHSHKKRSLLKLYFSMPFLNTKFYYIYNFYLRLNNKLFKNKFINF